jgi:hypothetical protein
LKPRVLWIEDSARLELRNLIGPIYYNGKYDFNLAEDVTTAVGLLRVEQFDALIVDVRLPPGIDRTWRKHYQRAGSDKLQAQLGLKLLRWLLSGDREIYPVDPPHWIKAHHIGVFTVESRREVQETLEALGITRYKQKVAGLPDTIMIELIEEILNQGQPAR